MIEIRNTKCAFTFCSGNIEDLLKYFENILHQLIVPIRFLLTETEMHDLLSRYLWNLRMHRKSRAHESHTFAKSRHRDECERLW